MPRVSRSADPKAEGVRPPPGPPQTHHERAAARRLGWADLGVALALLVLVAVIYGQVARHRFVYLDDNVYIFANANVTRGLSREGLTWAMTQFHSANWHPLTWLSHMLDCQLFGATDAAAGAHHLVSVGLHAASSILLFLALRLMTGNFWPSAVVAGLFAVHPLRVESVAWASERKDVLSGFFFMLTLLAYALYVKRPRTGPYILVLALTVAGLMSKPMLVTLPFVLLLLDIWPLRRWSLGQASPRRGEAAGRSPATKAWPRRRLLLEKVPLLAAAAGSSVMTLRAQAGGGAMGNVLVYTIPWRIVSAAVAYATYLVKTIWPSGLAPLYVHPATLPSRDLASLAVPATAGILLLIVVTVAVARQARLRPYLLTGWLWYAGMLVPVIGFFQVGVQLWADRYAYLPLIGVYIMITWGIRDLVARSRSARFGAGVVAGAAVAAYAIVAHAQVAVCRDSQKLFEHTLQVTRDNWMVENNYGAYLSFSEAGYDQARRHLERALRIKPDHAEAHGNLAFVLLAQDSVADARRHWEEALQFRPNLATAHFGLGLVLTREGKLGEARLRFEEAVRLNPAYAEAHANLGVVLARLRMLDEARTHLEEALRLDPNSVLAQHALARWLATAPDPRARDAKRALGLALKAAEQTEYRRPEVLASLAAVYAATGDFTRAAEWQRRALELVPDDANAGYREQLRLYEARRPLTSGADTP